MIDSSSRASVAPGRCAAVLLSVLGLYPMANTVALGPGLTWWTATVVRWVLWGVAVTAIALLLAKLFPKTWPRFHATAKRLLLYPSPRAFAAVVGLTMCVLSLGAGWWLFHWQPATIDELSQQWQAHLLTLGQLSVRSEAHSEFFSTMQTVQVAGRSFAQFPIGGPALIAIGMLVGAPWLVNPALAGIAAIAIYRFAAATSDEVEARAATLLFVLSPFALVIAGSELSHVGTLAAVWTALAALPRWVAAPTERDAHRAAAIIGASLGIAATIRPYDAAIVALVVGVFQLWTKPRQGKTYRSLATQTLVGAIPIALLIGANWATTGHPLAFAYDVLNGPEHRPGFHMGPLGVEHTPRHGIYTISLYLLRLNTVLLGWPVPAVALIALALAAQRRATRWDHLLIATLGGIVLGYWLYWCEGSFNGPRFLYTALPVFLIYIARLPRAAFSRIRGPTARTAAYLLVPLWILAAWLVPPSIAMPFGVWAYASHARQSERVTKAIRRAAAARHLENAVVFVDDGWHAKLASRLRAIGARPYLAQLVVGHVDACVIQETLDRAERTPSLAADQGRYVFSVLDEQPEAQPISGLESQEQLALANGEHLSETCRHEFDHARPYGVDLARLLSQMKVDSLGRISGPVVYARDFGERDALLRDRFGNRSWYRAHISPERDSVTVTLELLVER